MTIKRAEKVPPDPTKRPNFEPSPELLALIEYFKGRKPGDEISWTELEQETGLPMNLNHPDGKINRGHARNACRRVHPQGYQACRGEGIEIVGPETAIRKNDLSLRSIHRKVRVAHHEANAALQLDGLSAADRAQLDLRAAVLGALGGMTAQKALVSRFGKPSQPMLPIE